jgi:hypothetical protein
MAGWRWDGNRDAVSASESACVRMYDLVAAASIRDWADGGPVTSSGLVAAAAVPSPHSVPPAGVCVKDEGAFADDPETASCPGCAEGRHCDWRGAV